MMTLATSARASRQRYDLRYLALASPRRCASQPLVNETAGSRPKRSSRSPALRRLGHPLERERGGLAAAGIAGGALLDRAFPRPLRQGEVVGHQLGPLVGVVDDPV